MSVEETSRRLAAELAKPRPKKTIEPGLYPRGKVDYDTIAGHNFSTLKHADKSLKHYRYRLRNPQAVQSWMAMGTACHTAVLEPDRFMTDYVLFPGKRRAGKAWDQFVADNDGKQLIKRDEYDKAVAVRDAVRSDSAAGPYFEDGVPEIAMVWRDEETGLLCRGRTDWLATGDYLVDLKSSGDVRPMWFGRTGGRLRYHAQAAFYSDGYTAITGREAQVRLIAVEANAPHDVVVFRVLPEQLDAGRQLYREWLTKVADAERTNRWPGVGGGLEHDFQLPVWELDDENDLDDLGLEN